MHDDRTGQTVVIFVSQRTAVDDEGYAVAAEAMDRLAALQPGYRGIESARDAAGTGITVSFWADEASAIAWRNHAEHAAIRAAGRDRWYSWYQVIVCAADRSYNWTRE